MKKMPGDIIILHSCTIHDNQMMYGSWDMERDGQNFLSFWTIFCPLTTRKVKILKKWKTSGDVIILHTCTKNHDHMIISYTVPEIRHGDDMIYVSFCAIFCPFNSLTKRWTDGQKKWYIEMLTPSKKLWLQSENFSSRFFNILDI